jgi:hypothetical protein
MKQSPSMLTISSEHEALVMPTRLQHSLNLPFSGPAQELLECFVIHLFHLNWLQVFWTCLPGNLLELGSLVVLSTAFLHLSTDYFKIVPDLQN